MIHMNANPGDKHTMCGIKDGLPVIWRQFRPDYEWDGICEACAAVDEGETP